MAAYALLTGKNKELIRWCLNKFLQFSEEYNMQIRWERIMTDFEQSIVLAFREFCVEHQLHFVVSSCHFHFCQAMLRKAKEFGISPLLSEKKQEIGSKLRLLIRSTMALPLVPLNNNTPAVVPGLAQPRSRPYEVFERLVTNFKNDVDNTWQLQLINPPGAGEFAAHVIAGIQLSEQNAAKRNSMLTFIDKFAQYVRVNYTDETSNKCTPISQWSVAHLNDYRTNNNCEGTHNSNRIEYGHKPKLYDWILITKKLIAKSELELDQLIDNPLQHQKKDLKYRKKDEALGLLLVPLIETPFNIDVEMEFVKGVAKLWITSINDYVHNPEEETVGGDDDDNDEVAAHVEPPDDYIL